MNYSYSPQGMARQWPKGSTQQGLMRRAQQELSQFVVFLLHSSLHIHVPPPTPRIAFSFEAGPMACAIHPRSTADNSCCLTQHTADNIWCMTQQKMSAALRRRHRMLLDPADIFCSVTQQTMSASSRGSIALPAPHRRHRLLPDIVDIVCRLAQQTTSCVAHGRH